MLWLVARVAFLFDSTSAEINIPQRHIDKSQKEQVKYERKKIPRIKERFNSRNGVHAPIKAERFGMNHEEKVDDG